MLMVVSDRRRLQGRTLADLARAAARAGVDRMQVREKDLGGAELLREARDVMAAAAGSRLRVAINGRADVAFAAGAQGVHLPEQGLPARDVRDAFPGLEVGVSCHTLEAARRAKRWRASCSASRMLTRPSPEMPPRVNALSSSERSAGCGASR